MSSKQGHLATESCLCIWKDFVETEGLIFIQFVTSSVTGTEGLHITPYKHGVEQENCTVLCIFIQIGNLQPIAHN
jgi:hypothetical protein